MLQRQSYLDALGIQVAEDNFQALAGREAHHAVVGVHHHPVTMNFLPLCYMNWKISGTGTSSIQELSVDILKMMKSGEFDLSVLVSHEYKIDQISGALVMGDNSKEAQKVCITYV